MTQLIDRRLNGKNKSAVNRQRFLRRYREKIKKAAADAVSGRSITDATSGEKINIPARDISEPHFRHGEGGVRENVHPGNTDFVTGDRIARPPGGGSGGAGQNASDQGEGEDDFVFEISRDEFLEFFFEDLELPDLVKTQIKVALNYKMERAGHTREGVPSNINVVRSLSSALARRMALRGPHKKRLVVLEDELCALEKEGLEDSKRALELKSEIGRLRAKIAAVPFIDTFDLRYNNRVKTPRPTTQAVMFCVMDVSGSMDEQRKDIAKRFFILLYLFLLRKYERIQVVFIRHHTTAREVDEEEFFYARETGGTVVSNALKLVHDVIVDRYPLADWNIYVAQASDGDNWSGDSGTCKELLLSKILPCVQYYAYVEISPDRDDGLWQEYRHVAQQCAHFAMQRINGLTDIYPVFRRLMKKRET